MIKHATPLADRRCAECEGHATALSPERISELAQELSSSWSVQDRQRLRREYKFKDFRQALAFTQELGELAEREGHHPDIQLGWGYVRVEISTHSIGGLTEADFILAAKIDRMS